jgi:hypothetical protein
LGGSNGGQGGDAVITITKTPMRQLLLLLDPEDKSVCLHEREVTGNRGFKQKRWAVHDAVGMSTEEFLRVLDKSLPHAVQHMRFEQMARVVQRFHDELKRRNPIGVNLYTGYLTAAVSVLLEISEGEKENPTCEAGPKEKESKNG